MERVFRVLQARGRGHRSADGDAAVRIARGGTESRRVRELPMATDEQRALWSAILANPLDDTPRLVYADWLQEHGEEERAEFIRVQIELETFGFDRRKGRKQRPALEAR